MIGLPCSRTSHPSGVKQKIRRKAMATRSAVFFVFFIALYQRDPVFGCTVTPPGAVALAGNSVSLTCIPASNEYVTLWRRQNENKVVYAAPSVRTNRTADGRYCIDDSNPSQIILTVNETSIQYIDNYECTCLNQQTGPSKDYAYISMIGTEPQFNATSSLSSDDPVNLTCTLEFAGYANLLMQITNSAGNVLAQRSEIINTNVSQLFSLSNTTSGAFEKIYFCNISLSTDASDPKPTIFSRRLNTTVQFSVRNVSISPESPEHCQNGGLCQKNSAILCKAEGSPEPNYNLTIYLNGTLIRSLANQQRYTTEFVGQLIIQCTAFNAINGIVYSNSSNFSTNVTEGSVGSPGGGVSIPAIVVPVVVGVLLIIIAVILIAFWCKRKKRHQSNEPKPGDAIETNEFTKGNKGNGTNSNGQTNLAAISIDERVLVENTLYSGTKGGGAAYNTTIDPSDGGYAAIDELGTHRKG